jgi:hypothetical protein
MPPTDPPAPTPARGRSLVEVISVGVMGTLMGVMLAGSLLGVLSANERTSIAPRGATTALLAPTRNVPDASTEANPEEAGDGVMDDLDDGPTDDASVRTTTPPPRTLSAGVRTPSAATTAPSTTGSTPSRRRQVITSDNVPEGPAQGYVEGRPIRITVTRLDGKPVERHTAAAYRRMYDAASRDNVRLRIVSGFRTMEHQQALYRAWRRGAGNLAAVPGHSNHQSGHALDLNTSSPGVLRWLERNARRFGFRRTVPTEPWHWEWW